jgi:hypothetical protein
VSWHIDALRIPVTAYAPTLPASVFGQSTTLMERETFINNFRLLLTHLDTVTRQLCINDLSTNYKFILEPSEWNTSDYLTAAENDYLKTWNKLKDKQITFDEVVNVFHKYGQTPKWADCNIYYSTMNLTVIKIFFSRQFRDEKEIYYLERGTGPFKAVVATPFEFMEGKKFDVNWKKDLDDRKTSSIWTKIKRLIKSE